MESSILSQKFVRNRAFYSLDWIETSKPVWVFLAIIRQNIFFAPFFHKGMVHVLPNNGWMHVVPNKGLAHLEFNFPQIAGSYVETRAKS